MAPGQRLNDCSGRGKSNPTAAQINTAAGYAGGVDQSLTIRAARELTGLSRINVMPWSHSHPQHWLPRTSAAGGGQRHGRMLAAAAGLCCLLVMSAQAAAKDAPTWALDPVHTRVMFAVSHAGFSQAMGTISGSRGSLQFDPDDWGRTRLDATVPLQRLDLGDEAWNEATLARRLLDAQSHPYARFSSDSAVATRPGQALVCGDLSLHGITRPLCMTVTVNAIKRHPMPPFRRTAGFSATAVLSRSDYGIDAWSSIIGDEVTIRIEAEAVRSHHSTPDPGARQ